MQFPAVTSTHTYREKVDYVGLGDVGILDENLCPYKHCYLAQELAAECVVGTPLEVCGHIIAVKILAFIQERDVYVFPQTSATVVAHIGGQCRT